VELDGAFHGIGLRAEDETEESQGANEPDAPPFADLSLPEQEQTRGDDPNRPEDESAGITQRESIGPNFSNRTANIIPIDTLFPDRRVHLGKSRQEVVSILLGKKRDQGFNRHIVTFGDVPERHTVIDDDIRPFDNRWADHAIGKNGYDEDQGGSSYYIRPHVSDG
jgi:hypothetical protein